MQIKNLTKLLITPELCFIVLNTLCIFQHDFISHKEENSWIKILNSIVWHKVRNKTKCKNTRVKLRKKHKFLYCSGVFGCFHFFKNMGGRGGLSDQISIWGKESSFDLDNTSEYISIWYYIYMILYNSEYYITSVITLK